MATTTVEEARAFLSNKHLLFDEANALWKQLKSDDEIHLARQVLERIRKRKGLLDEIPSDPAIKAKLCQQHAELTSKDQELSVNLRHDLALNILNEFFHLNDKSLDGDGETLGIAGGICKRRWKDLGQYEDLICAAEYYTRGAKGPVGDDGYAHINAAFMQDLLAHASGGKIEARQHAQELREKILSDPSGEAACQVEQLIMEMDCLDIIQQKNKISTSLNRQVSLGQNSGFYEFIQFQNPGKF